MRIVLHCVVAEFVTTPVCVTEANGATSPVYYSVCLRSERRDPKKRQSFELLAQIPATVAENAPGAAYELLAMVGIFSLFPPGV